MPSFHILWHFSVNLMVLVLKALLYNRRAHFILYFGFGIYTTLIIWPLADPLTQLGQLGRRSRIKLTPCWPLNTIRTIRKKVKNQDIHPFYNCTTHTPEALTFTPPWFWLFPDHQQPFKLHPFIYYSIHTFGSSIILPPRFSPPNHERFHFKIEN